MNKAKAYLLSTALLLNTGAVVFSAGPEEDDKISVCSCFVPEGFQKQDSHLTFGELEVLAPFLYLENNQGETIPKEAKEAHYRHFIRYNTYPFSLPDDRGEQNTICFSTGKTLDPKAREVVAAIQRGVSQFIIQDCPDIKGLSVLKDSFSSITDRKGYSLHFFGDGHGNLGQIEDVLTQWSMSGSLAQCDQLDFAIKGMRNNTEKKNILGIIIKLLDLEACENLETLSLRFMHLTNADVDMLKTSLLSRPRKLKRLVLSFNDLDDEALGKNGTLEQLIKDTKTLGKMFLVDLRGNKLSNPDTWGPLNLIIRLRDRYLKKEQKEISFSFRIGFNGLTSEGLRHIKIQQLKPFVDGAQPEGFSSSNVSFLKDIFDGVNEAPTVLKKEWFLPSGDYFNLADQLLILRHGSHGAWKTLDLRGLKFKNHEDIESILIHLNSPAAIKKILLDGAFKDGVPLDKKKHEYTTKALRLFPNLTSLSLGHNCLSPIMDVYGDVITQSLKALDFSNNRMAHDEDGPTDQFLRNMVLSLYENPGLKFISLKDNFLCDDDFPQVLAGIQEGSSLAICDLSGNQFEFKEKSLQAELIKYLSVASSDLLDLTGNRIGLDVVKSIIEAYRQKISLDRTHRWPVLRINAYQKTSFTPIEEIGSVESFKSLAQAYDLTNQMWAEIWEKDSIKASAMHRQSLYTHINRIIDAFNTNVGITASKDKQLVFKGFSKQEQKRHILKVMMRSTPLTTPPMDDITILHEVLKGIV